MRRVTSARWPSLGRSVCAAVGIAAACTAVSVPKAAHAQKKARPDTFNLDTNRGALGQGEDARVRARRGDCVGALAGFDAAIKRTIEPTLRRDRGLCHEKLGHAFPAIDDLRAYLTALPDANDADTIREHLEALEIKVGLYKKQDETPQTSESPPKTRVNKPDAWKNVADDDLPPTEKKDAPQRVDTVYEEEARMDLPLRRGKGWSLGPVVSFQYVRASNSSATKESAEVIGARLGYSLGDIHGVYADLGYKVFNLSRVGYSLRGLATQVGYEARIPLSRSLDDQFLLGGALVYEHLTAGLDVASQSGIASGSVTNGQIGPRIHGGYRHLFKGKVALELSLDGAYLKTIAVTEGSSGRGGLLPFGANVALVFAL